MRTAASPSNGVGPLVITAIRPPPAQGDRGQPGDRVDLERGADAEHQVRPRGQRLRLGHRVGRQELAEKHHIGLHRTGAIRAARGAVLAEQAVHVLEGEPRPAPLAAGGTDRAVHLDHPLRSGLVMQLVDVLGDHRIEQAAALELRERPGGRRSAPCRPASGTSAGRSSRTWPGRGGKRRCEPPPSGRPSPTAPPRAAEVGDSRRHGDPGAGQGHRRPGLPDQAGEPLCLVSGYLPCHLGLRLPRNAEIPSLASSEKKAVAKPCFSASIPSSRSPLLETSLICSTATGAC